MELRHPVLTGTTSATGNNLQHEVVNRFEARKAEEQRRLQQMERMRKLRTLLAFLFVAAVAGGGFWAWRNGLFDQYLKRSAVAEPQPATVDSEQSAVKPAESVKPSRAAVEVAIDDSVAAYMNAEKDFRGATVDYWRNAPDADRPGKSKLPLQLSALVPTDKGKVALIVMASIPGKKMSYSELSPSAGTVELSKEAFGRLTAETPFLVLSGTHAYFSSATKKAQPTDFPPPTKDAGFNPSRMEFGKLYGEVSRLGLQMGKFRYHVSFNAKGLHAPVDVADVKFGEEVPYASFVKALEEKGFPGEAVLKLGRVYFKPIKP